MFLHLKHRRDYTHCLFCPHDSSFIWCLVFSFFSPSPLYFCTLLSCRLENVQYPYHLYISPSTRPGLNGPERPFQCPTCGVRFTRIQNLKQHMLIHSGESKSLWSYITFRIISAPSISLGPLLAPVLLWLFLFLFFFVF